MRFTDKTVVVTGAGRGIGAETARRFAAEGASVAVADIDQRSAQEVAASLPSGTAVRADVSSRDSLSSLVDQVTEELGGVDVWINNAMSCSETPFLDLTPEEVQRDIAVTLMGPLFASQEVIPGMIRRGGGVILNISSVNASAYFGNEAYSAAKAGLESLTRSIAVKYGRHGIRCNAVAPGSVATEYWEHRKELDPLVFEKVSQWYPLGRVGRPVDVSESLLFLASDAASWITGVVLPVEGGLMAGNLAMTQDVVPATGDDAAVGDA
jgi:meso-butanediol dehydrogenase/(S,S)-butanediol dehydrogenase/diacetyl reductase